MRRRAPSERRLADVGAALLAWSAALAVAVALGWLLLDIVRCGLPRLDLAFLTGPVEDAGRAGGIGPLIVSTLLILLVCLAAAAPLGIATAIYLDEAVRRGHWSGGVLRASLDILAGVPSIVFGLFGLALFADRLGLGFSILSGGLTLACMVLPILTRIAQQGIAAVASEQRLGAAALGLGRATTLRRVILPQAAPAIGVGFVLAIGRALAETAALIFTAGYVTRTPGSLLDSGRALSVHIYDLAMNVPGGDPNAYATALVLVLLLIGLNLVATTLTRYAARRAAEGPA